MLNALVIASLFATAQAGPVCTGTELSATAVGSGTASDPWQICTVEQLLHVSSEPDGNFLLVDDLDLMGINWPGLTSCSIFPTSGGFSGHFDGGGRVLSNLTSDDDGLFDCINGGLVENLTLRNVDVVGGWYGTGGLVGFADVAVIRDVAVSGRIVSDESTTGGVAGLAQDSYIERVSFTGQVDGDNNVGGVLGVNYWSTVADSYAYGGVRGSRNVGGLAGTAYGTLGVAHFDRCHASTVVQEDGTSSSPQAGSALGLVLGLVRFGAADGSGQDASVVLEDADLPTFGLVFSGQVNGAVLSTTRELLLDPDTYRRAGWDLTTVWVPPTRTTVPTLR